MSPQPPPPLPPDENVLADEQSWQLFIQLVHEQIGRIKARHKKGNWFLGTDTVEDISVDPDETGVYVTLEGDFIWTILNYLANEDEKSKDYCRFTVKVPYSLMDKLRS
jgi:hypothetical protein